MAMKNILTEHFVGGLVSGTIGFLSAIGVVAFQNWYTERRKPKYYLEKIYLELSKNWFSLACDIKDGKVGLHLLSNSCWDINAVANTDIDDETIAGALELLYKEINSYNNLCELGRTETLFNLRQGRSTSTDKLKVDNCRIPKALLSRIKQMKAIIFGELVRRKIRKEKEWNDKELDWRKAKNPYMVKP